MTATALDPNALLDKHRERLDSAVRAPAPRGVTTRRSTSRRPRACTARPPPPTARRRSRPGWARPSRSTPRARRGTSRPSGRRTASTWRCPTRTPPTWTPLIEAARAGMRPGATPARGTDGRLPGDPRPPARARLRAGQRGAAHQRPGVRDGVPGRRRARARPRPRGDRLRVDRDDADARRPRCGRSRAAASPCGWRRPSRSCRAGSRW